MTALGNLACVQSIAHHVAAIDQYLRFSFRSFSYFGSIDETTSLLHWATHAGLWSATDSQPQDVCDRPLCSGPSPDTDVIHMQSRGVGTHSEYRTDTEHVSHEDCLVGCAVRLACMAIWTSGRLK